MRYHGFPPREVKIKKERLCWGCCEKHEPGSKMIKNATVWEGEGYVNCYFCQPCDAFIRSNTWIWQELPNYGLEYGDLRNFDELAGFKEKYLKEHPELLNKQS